MGAYMQLGIIPKIGTPPNTSGMHRDSRTSNYFFRCVCFHVSIFRLWIFFSGETTEEICQSVSHLTTAQYKLFLSEILVEHLSPIREKIEYYLKNRDHLETVLIDGSRQAQDIAEVTMVEVRKLVGLRNNWRVIVLFRFVMIYDNKIFMEIRIGLFF